MGLQAPYVENHCFRQSLLDILDSYPVGMDQGIPEIICDKELLRDHSGYVFADDNPNHLFCQPRHVYQI